MRAKAEAHAERRSLVMSKTPWLVVSGRPALAGGVQFANVTVFSGGICDANCALMRSFIE
jgi:hypothetical protein